MVVFSIGQKANWVLNDIHNHLDQLVVQTPPQSFEVTSILS